MYTRRYASHALLLYLLLYRATLDGYIDINDRVCYESQVSNKKRKKVLLFIILLRVLIFNYFQRRLIFNSLLINY